MKYAVIKSSSLESGKVFIAPTSVMDDSDLARDRAVFGADAYGDEHVVVELRVVYRAKPKGQKAVKK